MLQNNKALSTATSGRAQLVVTRLTIAPSTCSCSGRPWSTFKPRYQQGQLSTQTYFKFPLQRHAGVSPAACNEASTSLSSSPDDEQSQYCVVNFYHLVDIPEPQQLVEEHRKWIESKGYDIRGRIYYSAQGVNAQYGGLTEHATAYVEWIAQQPLFQGVRYSVWPATGHMFPKLRLKHKPNLISLAGGLADLPVTDPSARATPLEPSQWKQMIRDAKERNVVVLDVRNDYEWDAGHFEGAQRPAEEEFNDTPVGESDEDVPQPLRGLPADTPVMMYCTGGIRCDIYSTFLKHKGFQNLYTLEGGIQNYLRQEGPEHWKGSLYVFDGRMAIPSNLASDGSAVQPDLPAAIPCQLCGSPDSQLPHMNCANVDCNELYIACELCKKRLKGCCCEACMQAPRLLRPFKIEGGHYGAWGNYADQDELGPLIAAGRSREGRVARRARRRELMKQKRTKQIEEKLARKQLIREAMAKLSPEVEQPKQEQQQQPSSPEQSSLLPVS